MFVFSFNKLKNVDIMFGLEMKFIGEVMGKDLIFEKVLYKGFIGSGFEVKDYGIVLMIVSDKDKDEIVKIVYWLNEIGYKILVICGIV